MMFVKSKGSYKQVSAKELKDMLYSAKKVILSSTRYSSEYLITGTACDSSDQAFFRMAFVKLAEEQFIKDHYQEILANAAQLVQHDIDVLEGREEKIEQVEQQEWQVDVTRITRDIRTYTVTAGEQWAAQEAAIQKAQEDKWGETDAEYSIETCTRN